MNSSIGTLNSTSTIQSRVLRGPSTTAIRRGSLRIERTHAKQGSTIIGEILPDGSIFVNIRWSHSTHTLSPSPAQVGEYFQFHKRKPVHIRFTKQTGAVISSNAWRLELKEYFDVFLEALSRWKSIRLWAPYIPRESFVGRVFPEAHLLEHVILEGPPSFDIPVTSHLISHCWNGSHCLKTFELISKVDNSISSMMVNPRTYLPLDNITQIRLCNKLTIFECSEILFRAPNLADCLFSNITGSNSILSPLRCRSLQKLKLMANSEDYKSSRPVNLGLLFESFRAPKLRYLKMGSNNHWEDDHLSFVTFLQRSRCNLEALELDQIKITGPQLRAILLLAPSLRVLKVHGTPSQNPQPFTHNVMWGLTRSSGNTSLLCSQLEMFSINDTVVKNLPDGMITKMLSGRIDDMKMIWFKLSEHLSHQPMEVTKLTAIAMNRRILKVLVDSSSASAREWDESVCKNLAAPSKPKNTYLVRQTYGVDD